MQLLVQMQELFALALDELCDRDAGPALDDLCDLLLRDLVAQEVALLGVLRQRLFLRQLLPELGQLAVLQTGGRLEVIALLCLLDLRTELFDLLTQLLDLADGILLVFPLGLHGVELIALLCQLLAQLRQAALRELVGLVLQRSLFDLHLDDLAADNVQLRRHGIHLRADHGTGLIDKVNGLVRQEAVRDITVGQRGRRDDGGIRDLHAVEDLVALLQATQDGDGVFDGRLLDEHGLETALQRRVLFDILAVFIERRCADAVQLAARQHRLEQVARVHAALGLACADDGVQLIDEQDDAPLGVLHFVQDGLQALFKFAAVLCARDERAHVQREDRLVLQGLRHVAADDPLRQSFGDGRLADARLADEHGVVLRLARQDADDVSDLVVTADDRVRLLFAGVLHQIGAVFLQRLIGVLRAVRRHAAAAADGLQGLQAVLLADAIVRKQRRDGLVGRVEHGKEQVLHGDVFVPHALRRALGLSHQAVHSTGNIEFVGIPAGAADARQLFHGGLRRSRQALDAHAHFLQQLRDEPAVLLQQSQKQVSLLDLLILMRRCDRLRTLQGLQCFLRILIRVHNLILLSGGEFRRGVSRSIRRIRRSLFSTLVCRVLTSFDPMIPPF